MDAKKIDNDILVDAELNLFNKNTRKEISSITDSGITLTNNEIKDIITVIKFLKTEEFYLKELLQKLLVKKEGF